MTYPSRIAFALLLPLPLVLGFSSSTPLRVYPGPADPAYSVDLPARFRVGEPTFFRWLGRGGFDLPFRLGAPGVLSLDYEIATSALVAVRVEDEVVGRLQLLPGASRARLVIPAGHRLSLRFEELESDREDRRRASFFRIEVASARLYPTLRAAAAAAALPWLVVLLLALARLRIRDAVALALVACVLEAWLLRGDPYASLRLVERLLAPIALVGGPVALVLRSTRWSPWVFAAFLTGLTLRLAILLYPFAYHYDHQAHAGMVQALLDKGVFGFWNEQEELQVALNVGEIEISGAKRAFPYPTFFYLVSGSVARLVGSIDYAMMIVASIAASLEVLLVASLAGVFRTSERGRAYAAFASALYPASYGLLTLVLYPSMVAHVAEVGALVLLGRLPEPPDAANRSQILLTGGAIALAGSIHAGAFLDLTVFCFVLAIVSKSWRPLVLGASALTVSLLVSYRGYFTLLPVMLRSPSEDPYSSYWLQLEPPQQFAFMGGYLWPLLGLVGLVLLVRRRKGAAFLVAWGLAFLLMRVLRVGLGPPGAHLKELQFVAPLVALGIGEVLDRLSERRTWLGASLTALLAVLAGRWVVDHERWITPVIRDAGEQRAGDPEIPRSPG